MIRQYTMLTSGGSGDTDPRLPNLATKWRGQLLSPAILPLYPLDVCGAERRCVGCGEQKYLLLLAGQTPIHQLYTVA
jgi:hypothetical protein